MQDNPAVITGFSCIPLVPPCLVLLFLELYFLAQWPSPPGTFHSLIGKLSYFVIRFLNQIYFVINFSYFVIRFLLSSFIVKFDNKIGKVNEKQDSKELSPRPLVNAPKTFVVVGFISVKGTQRKTLEALITQMLIKLLMLKGSLSL